MGVRTGILGGTFDPVHVGHLILAQDALERFELDRVLLVPCAAPPHKTGGPYASAEHRAAMLEAAVEGDPRFEVSRIEFEREGPSYTVETLRELRRRFPERSWVFIIGSDTLAELHGWRDVGELLSLCEIATLVRPGFEPARLAPDNLKLGDAALARALLDRVAAGHRVDLSSTEIRMRLAEGLGIRYLVPDPVEMFIAEHGLYRA